MIWKVYGWDVEMNSLEVRLLMLILRLSMVKLVL